MNSQQQTCAGRQSGASFEHAMNTMLPKLTFLLLCAAAGSACAGTNGFIVPLFRGSASSQAGY
jgi:hypothetical protein